MFVAAPHKEPPVLALLCKNKARLIDYLHDFQNDKGKAPYILEQCTLLVWLASGSCGARSVFVVPTKLLLSLAELCLLQLFV